MTPSGGKARDNCYAVIFCAVYAFVLMLFLSPDSYLYDLYCRGDSSTFFTAGKAWMNGMVPYVDFADSKGPLLWLIYGMGYLISHHSYVGVFWVSIIFYTATLLFAYKLACLFTDKRTAALTATLLPLFLLRAPWHFEIRAEDFCNTFVMLSLYTTCLVIKNRDANGHSYFRWGGVMGVACMCCLLIKYSIAMMLCSLMAVVLWYALWNRRGVACVAGMVTGLFLTVAPFVVCFLVYGNLGAFIQEYFVNTYLTMENLADETVATLPVTIDYSWLRQKTYIVELVGLLLFCFIKKAGYWLLPCLLFFFVLGTQKTIAFYMLPALCFLIFTLTIVTDIVLGKRRLPGWLTPLTCIAAAIVTITANSRSLRSEFARWQHTRQDYCKMGYVMSQIDKPTIIFFPFDTGIGVQADCLPACTQWVGQVGATTEMLEGRQEAVRKGVADFVCIEDSSDQAMTAEELARYGYQLYCTMDDTYFKWPTGGKTLLYGRPGLSLPPDDFYVSDRDILLKRNIFGI